MHGVARDEGRKVTQSDARGGAMLSERETLHQAAQRLLIVASWLNHRFDVEGRLAAPLGVPNDIMAMRLILDRIERETQASSERQGDHGEPK
jgi:hypothetical protein